MGASWAPRPWFSLLKKWAQKKKMYRAHFLAFQILGAHDPYIPTSRQVGNFSIFGSKSSLSKHTYKVQFWKSWVCTRNVSSRSSVNLYVRRPKGTEMYGWTGWMGWMEYQRCPSIFFTLHMNQLGTDRSLTRFFYYMSNRCSTRPSTDTVTD